MMAMLTLNGQVINVFDSPAYTDKKTGEVAPAKHRVQIMAENTMQNGQQRMKLVNLTVDDPSPYRALQGRAVRVPVGAFANGGAIQYYALKAHQPEAVAAPAGMPAQAGAQRGAAPSPAGPNGRQYLIHVNKSGKPVLARLSRRLPALVTDHG